MKDLIQRMRSGDRRALARLLSYVEGQDDRAFELLKEVWPFTGHAITVGITGPAGAGKSTLIDQLIHLLREKKKKVGIVAVDPSSPFSGGAVLGDRVRMQRHSKDPDVFIRSVGSRGKSGGISFSTRALMHLLDAYGMDVLLVETVGAGQSEVDVMDIVDTTVVVLMPEVGDSIQALKAGMLEIANVFAVNKKDCDGANQVVQDLETMISFNPSKNTWRPSVVLTQGTNGEGVEKLWQEIEKHQEELNKQGPSDQEILRRRLHELSEIVRARLASEFLESFKQSSSALKQLSSESRPNLYAIADDFAKEFRHFAEAKRPSAKSGK